VTGLGRGYCTFFFPTQNLPKKELFYDMHDGKNIPHRKKSPSSSIKEMQH
jgi:hypothetical protein